MILLIDDERSKMISYIEELKLSGYRLEYRKDVSVGFNFLKDHLSEVELLILDIMMPSGNLLDHGTTTGGLRTGVRLYDRVRELTPDLPVIILTNVSDAVVARRFQKEAHCWFVRKEDCLPFELVEEVEIILSGNAKNDLEGGNES